ncbi:hypothetical protein B0H66DRAFT_608521 [Apodospora peruviana]|uniref:Uncharacterized protein n=1 Tax=Apodospora peruviana TaxID=516989 RepID=A0AAE0HTB6_9PEZI|nr:hypothetical protein B0H66DRAFT_608521 [Apodospora peruviana]
MEDNLQASAHLIATSTGIKTWIRPTSPRDHDRGIILQNSHGPEDKFWDACRYKLRAHAQCGATPRRRKQLRRSGRCCLNSSLPQPRMLKNSILLSFLVFMHRWILGGNDQLFGLLVAPDSEVLLAGAFNIVGKICNHEWLEPDDSATSTLRPAVLGQPGAIQSTRPQADDGCITLDGHRNQRQDRPVDVEFIATPDFISQLFMRFRMFHAPSKHSILCFKPAVAQQSAYQALLDLARKLEEEATPVLNRFGGVGKWIVAST